MSTISEDIELGSLSLIGVRPDEDPFFSLIANGQAALFGGGAGVSNKERLCNLQFNCVCANIAKRIIAARSCHFELIVAPGECRIDLQLSDRRSIRDPDIVRIKGDISKRITNIISNLQRSRSYQLNSLTGRNSHAVTKDRAEKAKIPLNPDDRVSTIPIYLDIREAVIQHRCEQKDIEIVCGNAWTNETQQIGIEEINLLLRQRVASPRS